VKIYLDGKYVSEDEAKISVFDHGLLYGDGVFEGIRLYGGRIFRLTSIWIACSIRRRRSCCRFR
jgi:branched-subunit amino acid aminotransferase/4-amino-4-deoxychorismate lyase